MSMRYSKGKVRPLRLFRSILLPLGAGFLMVALTVAFAGKSHAPWLPIGDSGASDHGMEPLVGLLVGGAAAVMWLVARSCLGRAERLSGQKKPAWRYREMSRREKRRLAAVLMLSSSILSLPLALKGSQGGATGPVFWIFVISGSLGTLTGLAMTLVHVRPSRTVMQIVEERTRDDAEAVLDVLAEMRAEDAREMEAWKNETIADLYAMIIDQVERGVISCKKCKESDTAHFAGRHGEQPVPEPRHAEDISKPCECGGPASIRVIYPPRFQSKRTAS